MGYWEYLPIALKFQVPIGVTGFEPVDILQGILQTVLGLEKHSHLVENAYSRVVSLDGNQPAQKIIRQVFEDCDQKWRGIGMIPMSGWKLKPEYSQYDAEERYQLQAISPQESPLCVSGKILQGLKKPLDCQVFGIQCTPEHPLGATMVSSEGACAAYYQYGRST